jgi:plasmid stabilization system protein ParE
VYGPRGLPLAFRVVPGREDTGTRRFVVRSWAIYYEVREPFIDIVRIVYARRDVDG